MGSELVISPERNNPMFLYHVTAWEQLSTKGPGESFALNPGSKHAQGWGVYFSEQLPRFTAAEGSRGKPVVVVKIGVNEPDAQQWYRSKMGASNKYQKPRTWHTRECPIDLTVIDRQTENYDGRDITVLYCSWELGKKP